MISDSRQCKSCLEFCFYTAAFGEKYEKLAQVLGYSMNKFGLTLNVFTNAKKLNYCNIIKIDEFINDGYHFKIHYLKTISKLISSKYYIWIDCDCYFFKNPLDYIYKFENFDFVFFPEINLLLNKINKWSGVFIQDMIKICDIIKVKPLLYNCNGGLFIISNLYVNDFFDKIMKIKALGGKKWTDEHSYSIMMASNYSKDDYNNTLYFSNLNLFFCDTLKISNKFMKNNINNKISCYETVNFFNKNEFYKLNECPCIIHFLFDETILLNEYNKLFNK